MKIEAWEAVLELFEQAMAKPEPDRDAFVQRTCDGDPQLLRAVRGMIAADRQADNILDQPLVERCGVRATPRLATAAVSPPTLPSDGSGGLPVVGWPPRYPLVEPDWIGPYRIIRQIGQGGMSTVYLASRDDDTYHKQVAIKVVRHDLEHEPILRRLRAERQILASLEHPNIARLYDGGTTDEGLPFFVMEYVEGEPIDLYCDHYGLTVDQRLTLFHKVCQAVHHAHQNLVIHRDLKPTNILVDRSGDPKLLDFGIAKVLNPTAWALDIEPTRTVHRMLTPSYASPEQYRGKLVSTAGDVYSLGVLLYELLTGRLPFDFAGLSPAEVERQLIETEPKAPSMAVSSDTAASGSPALPRSGAQALFAGGRWLSKTLAGDLDAIVLKALRSLPQARYGSAEQLAAEIERYRTGLPIQARQGSWRYRSYKFAQRHRALLAATAATGLLLLVVAITIMQQAARVAQERDQAQRERNQKSAIITLFEDLIAEADPLRGNDRDLTVRELLGGSSQLLVGRLTDQPATRAALLHTTGGMLAELASLADARAHLEEAIALRTANLGPDHPETAASMGKLARVLLELGELTEAERLGRRSVDLLRQRHDPDPIALSAALRSFALVLWARNDLDNAAARAREALDLVADGQPSLHDTARSLSLNLLGQLEAQRGQYDRAAAATRRSLAIVEQRYGEESPRLIPILNNLALALRWSNELEEAEQMYLRARALILASYGENHQVFAVSSNNLGGVRFARGDYDGAASAYSEARHTMSETLGADHWRVFFVETNLASARIRLGDIATAEHDLRAGIAHWRARLKADHWLFAQANSLLGEAAAAQGRVAEAEDLLTTSLRRLIAVAAKDRYQRKALERLSAFLTQQGRSDEIAAFELLLAAGADAT